MSKAPCGKAASQLPDAAGPFRVRSPLDPFQYANSLPAVPPNSLDGPCESAHRPTEINGI